jgi:hypothetical protein
VPLLHSVILQAVIAIDGTVRDLRVVSRHLMQGRAALEAMQLWCRRDIETDFPPRSLEPSSYSGSRARAVQHLRKSEAHLHTTGSEDY